ncbi:MAG: T9SS type A sorting domain-containing protein [Prevotella sp.]|jgi:hypothetical protein|nr:T9SS type A sorting domain-containing protein [Prevotella sp.]
MKSKNYLKTAICLTMSFLALASAQGQNLVWSAEAEAFNINQPANPADPNNFPKINYQEENCYTSGCAYVSNISANSGIVFTGVTVPAEGTYELWMYYMLVDTKGRGIGVTPNYQVRDTAGLWVMEQTDSWDGSPLLDTTDPDNPVVIPGTGGTKIVKKLIYLEAGTNQLKIGGSGKEYTPNFDKFEIYTTTETIVKPANVSCSWQWDYTDETGVTVTLNGAANEDVKKVYDNNDETYLEVPGNSYIDFAFPYEHRFTGFLIFTDRANPIDVTDFDVQTSATGDGGWASGSKTATTARGQGQVFQTTMCDGDAQRYKYFRLQFNKLATDVVKLSEIQFFGYPSIEPRNAEQGWCNAYPEDLIEVQIQNWKTLTEEAIGLNGDYKPSDAGLINETNSWFECASRAIDGREKTKLTIIGKKEFSLEYIFSESVIAKSYSLAICATNSMDRNPKNWVLEASEDWGDTWMEVARVEGFTWPACTYNTIKFPVAEEFWGTEYSGYRINITNNGGADSHVSEFQLMSAPIYVPSGSTAIKPAVSDINAFSAYAKKGAVVFNSNPNKTGTFNIYSLTGSLVKSGTLTSGGEVSLQPGAYLVSIASKDGSVYKNKVIVR